MVSTPRPSSPDPQAQLPTGQPAAGRVHGGGDTFPPGDLFGAVNARRARIADALRRDLCGFADDQSGTGALGGVSRVERPRYIAAAGSITRHWRHHDSIGQLQRTELEW